MIKRKKLVYFLTLFILALIVIDVVVYIILSSLGILNMSENKLDVIFAITTPILIFVWSFLLIKDLEYKFIFRELKIQNKQNLGLDDSTFYNFTLLRKSMFAMRNYEDKKYYAICFTPCAQNISLNLVRNEILIHYNGLIAKFLEKYFKENKKYKRFDHSYCYRNGMFYIFVLGDTNRVSEILEYFETELYNIARTNEIRIFVQPYFGISEYAYGTSIEETFENAILAKFQSERNFEVSSYYTPELRNGAKLSQTEDILEALENKEFEVYYQPKYSLTEHKFISSEALVRWNSSKYGFLNPGQFIDKAERAGLIHQIDMYVFNRVCEDINDARRRGKRVIPVSINFSMYEFYSPTFVSDIMKCIEDNNVPKNLIEIEITETTTQSNPFLCISIMKQIKGKGLRILMDDFGTGYSNFSNLRKIPIDCLKIDKSFIDEIVDDRKTREIVRFLIALGKNNDLEVIAEGVDRREQIEILRKAHLDTIQGFYYSRPLCKKDYEDFLMNNKFEKMGGNKEWF